VECTAEVRRILQDKHVMPELKQRVIKQILQLARGDWQPSLTNTLKLPSKSTLNLFETKLSKKCRVIWEKAIGFSPRLSKTTETRLKVDGVPGDNYGAKEGRIYSEIIRVWDIVFDHDNIKR